MGCASSQPGINPAFDVCRAAAGGGYPCDIDKLRAAVKGLPNPAQQLSEVDKASGKTALEYAVLCKNAAAACDLLISAGANPLVQRDGQQTRHIVCTAIGLSARYEECLDVIPILCKALDKDGWKRIKEELGQHSSHEVGSCQRVEHKVKGKGTTAFNADKDKDLFSTESGDIMGVNFDSGGDLFGEAGGGVSIAARKDLTVLRQLNEKIKNKFVEAAKTAECEESIVEALQGMENGTWKPYGVA